MTVAGFTALSVETSTNVPDADLAGDPRHEPRGQGVVAHRLDRVQLHHRDVLVGRGVEDDVRPVLGEHLAHPLLLLAVGQDRDRGADVAILLELAQDLEQVVLGVVDQDEPARAHPGDLAAQLAADRAAGAGDQHDLALQIGADTLELHPHRARGRACPRPGPRAADGRRAAARCRPGAARTRSEWSAPGSPASRQAATTRARSVPGAEGMAMITSSGSTSSTTRAKSSARSGADDLEAVLVLHPELPGVVVDEADGPQAQLWVANQLAGDQTAALAATDDQHVTRALGGAERVDATLAEQMHGEPRADQEREHQQHEVADDAAGERDRARAAREHEVDRVQQRDRPDHEQRRHGDRLDHRLVVALAHERPQPLVLAETGEHEHA